MTHRKHIERKLEFEINRFLATVIRKRDDDIWEYEKGWGDYEIAEKYEAQGVTLDQVKRLRLQVFGPIQQKPRMRHPGTLDEVYARLTECERRIGELEKEMATAKDSERGREALRSFRPAVNPLSS